jgi:hypothetical protein
VFKEFASECNVPKPKPKTLPPEMQKCVNGVIAKWAAEKYNVDDKLKERIILVDKLDFFKGDKPFTVEDKVRDAQGKIVKDENGDEQKVRKPIVDKAGKPVTRPYSWCAQLKSDFDKEYCRVLFATASGCVINYPDPDQGCLDGEDATVPVCKKKPADKPAEGSGSGASEGSAGSGSAGSGSAVADGSAGSGSGATAGSGSGSAAPPVPAITAECRKACVDKKIKECQVEKVEIFVDEQPLTAYDPPLGQKTAEEIAAIEGADKQQGCSAGTGAAGGLLFAGSALVYALRHQRRRRRYM